MGWLYEPSSITILSKPRGVGLHQHNGLAPELVVKPVEFGKATVPSPNITALDAWFMEFKVEKIIKVNAFFDKRLFDDLFTRAK